MKQFSLQWNFLFDNKSRYNFSITNLVTTFDTLLLLSYCFIGLCSFSSSHYMDSSNRRGESLHGCYWLRPPIGTFLRHYHLP